VTRHLVVEGLIGVGKTSLCRLLERERGATLVLEPAATNPFLEPFYSDPPRYAFPVQMFYLINRWRQQSQIRQGDLFNRLVVSDYLFEKDRLFAAKTLPPEELELYDRFAGVLGEIAPKPDLVLFLEAPISAVMRRIARRQAPGEQAITEDYLEDLRERYDKLFASFTGCPVLRLDTQDMNYVDDPVAQRGVLQLVDQALDQAVLGGPLPTTPGSRVDREVQQQLFSGEVTRSKR
jgi:deoxyguanosine kinase